MKKIITIDGKQYTMQSSAYTQFAYKNETGRSLLKDLQEVINITQNKDDDNFEIEELDHISELVLKISFIMIKEADEGQITDYVSFLKSIGNLYDDYNWVLEAIELAATPLSGRLQANQN